MNVFRRSKAGLHCFRPSGRKTPADCILYDCPMKETPPLKIWMERGRSGSHALLVTPILLGIGRTELFHLAHWLNVWKHLQRK